MALPSVDTLQLALGSSFSVSELERTNEVSGKVETVLWILTPFLDTKNDAIYVTLRESENSDGNTLLYISDERYASDFLWSIPMFRTQGKKALKMVRKLIRHNNTVLHNGYLFIRLLPEEGKDPVFVANQIKNLTRIILIVTSLPITMSKY